MLSTNMPRSQSCHFRGISFEGILLTPATTMYFRVSVSFHHLVL